MVNFDLITICLSCSSLTSQKLIFDKFNNADINISNNTIGSMICYLCIFISFITLKFTYFKFQNHASVCTLLAHYIIICFICKVGALNEEQYSNICEAVCNIYRYLYTKLVINTYCIYTHDIRNIVVSGLKILTCEVVSPCP